MSVYIFGIFIFIMTAAVAVLFRRRFEIVLPCCIFYIILILYLSGLFSSFRPGLYLVWATLPAAGILCLVKRRKTIRDNLKNYVFTPGFFFMLVSYGAFLPCVMKMHLNTWDEFTHWGTVIKNFCYFHDFANLENATTFLKEYPPAVSLFAYFAQCFGKNYVECKSYAAYVFLFLALMSPYFVIIKGRNDWFKAVMLGLCCILLPTLMGERVYDILLVDAFLGLETALLFAAYLFYEDERWKMTTVGMTAAVLCLTKASGAGLAGIALCILIVVELCQRADRTKSGNRRGILLLAVLTAGLLFGKYSWEFYLRISETPRYWQTSNVSAANLFELVSGRGAEYQYETIGNFIHAAAMQTFTDSIVPMSSLGWLAVLLLFCVFMKNMTANVEDGKKIRVCVWGIVAGIVPYACSMLFLYLFTFYPGEAVEVASFDRYMSTYIVAAVAVLMVVFFYCLSRRSKWGAVVAFVVMGLTTYLPIYKAIVTAMPICSTVYDNGPLDGVYQRMKGEVLDQCGKEDIKVYFAHPDDSGFWYYVCLYGITPWHVQNVLTDGIGSFQAGETLDDWEKKLREGNFTHVLVNVSNDGFEERFGEMFQGKTESGLYEIVDVDGQMKLEKIWDIEKGIVED